ncbi:MAG TPA: hypothetical protein VGD14_01910, partial [bacterium]
MLALNEHGSNKLFCDKEGFFWIEVDSNWRKVTSPDEIRRFFQGSRKIYADEILVEECSINDLNKEKFERYIQNVYKIELSEFKIPIETLLENLHLAKNRMLN